jgi:carbonic anhydrase/acetyltransferase-like protein (isoleucine patch superfamily)
MMLSFGGKSPRLGEGVFLAPTATLIGDVTLGEGSSVWFGTVVRGDVHTIRIGARTNVQDLSLLHVTGGKFALTIGDDVTIGHHCVVHGCTVGSRVLIGMGAVVLDGATIGEESIVAAGAVVPEGATFPPRSLLMGIPAKKVRDITDADVARILEGRDNYKELQALYRAEGLGQ